MLVEFKCRNCGVALEGDSELSGGQMDCPSCGAALLVPHPAISIGTRVAGFRIDQKIGAGGMGDVYLATQVSMDRRVALKVLPPAMVANPNNLQRFLYEIRMTGQLEHPNIVAVHDAGEFEGVYYLAMSFIDGEAVGERLERGGRFNEQETLETLRAVANALTFAWQKLRILHRDIKPANIMIDRDGVVKLLDLGLAKSLDADLEITQGNMVVGTPYYMSPEQANPTRDPDFRADMYSLGATAFHMLTGQRPYEGKTPRDIILQAFRGPVPCLRQFNKDLSPECERLIQKMMAPKPENRFNSWQEMLDVVNKLLRKEEAPAVQEPVMDEQQEPTLSGLHPVMTPPAFTRSALLPAVVKDSWRRRRKFKVAAVFLVVCALSTAGGYGGFKLIEYLRAPAVPEQSPDDAEADSDAPDRNLPPDLLPVEVPQTPARPTVEELRLRLDGQIREDVRKQLATPEVQQEICRRLHLEWPVREPLLSEPDIKLVIKSRLAKALEDQFPPTLERELWEEANRRFGVLQRGDQVSMLLRGGVGPNPVASGRFGGVEGGHVIIGSRRVLVTDLDRDDRVRLDPEASGKRQEEFVRDRLRRLENEKADFLKEQEKLLTEQVYSQSHYIWIADRWRSKKDVFNEVQQREQARRQALLMQQLYAQNGLAFRQGEWVYADDPEPQPAAAAPQQDPGKDL